MKLTENKNVREIKSGKEKELKRDEKEESGVREGK